MCCSCCSFFCFLFFLYMSPVISLSGTVVVHCYFFIMLMGSKLYQTKIPFFAYFMPPPLSHFAQLPSTPPSQSPSLILARFASGSTFIFLYTLTFSNWRLSLSGVSVRVCLHRTILWMRMQRQTRPLVPSHVQECNLQKKELKQSKN